MKSPVVSFGRYPFITNINTLNTINSSARMPKIMAQQIKVSQDKPVTDRDLLILRTIRPKPNVWTVPASVKIRENCPSLKTKYRIRIIIARITQQRASYFLNIFIIITNIISHESSTIFFPNIRLLKLSANLKIFNMKQQLQKNRQELINHIEVKLAMLKQKRDYLLNQSNPAQISEKVKLSNYLKNQQHLNASANTNIDKEAFLQQHVTYQKPRIYSKKEIIENKQDAKQKSQMLKRLYQRKRELQSVGIYENNPEKIKKIYESQANVSKIKNDLTKSKKKAEQKQEKNRIIQQQLTKVQAFLRQSKRQSKIKSIESKYTYTQLLKGQRQKLDRYEQLLSKGKLSVLDKESLLKMTFDLIKQFPQRISKKILQQYLLSNNGFCKIFYLTKIQIMRDLQVHKTKQDNYLDYEQFYQFIKSVEITNKAIKPTLNYQTKSSKSSNRKKEEEQKSKQLDSQKMIQQYLKKVFIYLDQRHQKIVERQRIQIALTKCLLYDVKKMTFAKQIIIKFAQYIQKKTIPKAQKNYYAKLDLKYIGMEELLQFYGQYSKQKVNHQNSQQLQELIGEQERNNSRVDNQQSKQVLEEKQVEPTIMQNVVQTGKISNLQQDFQKFGWEKDASDKQHFSQLRQLDNYYNEMRSKYGNQIHWNNYKVYQQDFNKFNECISKMGRNKTESKEIVGLKIQFTVQQEDQEQIEDKQ